LFLLCAQKPEALPRGKYYDLLGFPVWIYELDNLLLKGRVLTFAKVGGPEPQAELVLENVPDNYFELAMQEGGGCCSCGDPTVKRVAS
jgi:hypothetical protein